METIKVLLVEDHAVVRAGLKMLINTEPDMEVVGELDSGLEIISYVQRLTPHVILMDISMQGINGLEATRLVNEENSNASVLILTMHEDEEYFFQALQAGALGYIPKSAPEKEVLNAIRSVYKKKSYLHPSMAHFLVNEYLDKVKPGDERSGYERLTAREKEVMLLVAKGFTNKEIAEKLTISVHTVHNHRTKVMEKLGVNDKMELLKYAIKKRLLDLN